MADQEDVAEVEVMSLEGEGERKEDSCVEEPPVRVEEDSSKPTVELKSEPLPPKPSLTDEEKYNTIPTPRDAMSRERRSLSRDARLPPSMTSSSRVYQSASSSKYRGYDDRGRSPYSTTRRSDVDPGYDPDYTSRLLAAAAGGRGVSYSPFSRSSVSRTDNVADNIRFHPIIDRNNPEAPVNRKISNRSRHVMLQGYDMGFTSPALKSLYDVRV